MLGLGGWHGGERDFTSLCNASTGRGSPDFFDWWVSVRQCQPKSYCIHQKVSICLAEKHSVFQATSCMRQPWLKGMDRKEKSPGKKDRQRNWSNITCKGNFPHQNLSFSLSLFICPHTLSTKIGKEASIPRAFTLPGFTSEKWAVSEHTPGCLMLLITSGSFGPAEKPSITGRTMQGLQAPASLCKLVQIWHLPSRARDMTGVSYGLSLTKRADPVHFRSLKSGKEIVFGVKVLLTESMGILSNSSLTALTVSKIRNSPDKEQTLAEKKKKINSSCILHQFNEHMIWHLLAKSYRIIEIFPSITVKSTSAIKTLIHQRVQATLKGGSQRSCQIHEVMIRVR